MTLPEFVKLCESYSLVYHPDGNSTWIYATIPSKHISDSSWLLAYNTEEPSVYLADLIYTDGTRIFFSDYVYYSQSDLNNKLNIINGLIKSLKENEVNSKIKSIESDFNS